MEIFNVIESRLVLGHTLLSAKSFKELPEARKYLRAKVAEWTNTYLEIIESFEPGYSPGEPISRYWEEDDIAVSFQRDRFHLKLPFDHIEVIMDINQTELK